MLTNFFNKTTPLNYLVVITLFIVMYVFKSFLFVEDFEPDFNFFKNTTIQLAFVLGIYHLLLVKYNKNGQLYLLSQWVFLILVSPGILNIGPPFLISVLLCIVWFKLENLSQRTLLHIFDLGILIGLLVYIQFWYVVLIPLIFIVIGVRQVLDLKNILAFVLGVFVFVLLYFLYLKNYTGLMPMSLQPLSFEVTFGFYWDDKMWFITSFMLFFLVMDFLYLYRSSNYKKEYFNLSIPAIMLVTLMGYLLIYPNKERADYLQLMPFLAVYFSNTIDAISKKWIKEVVTLLYILSFFLGALWFS